MEWTLTDPLDEWYVFEFATDTLFTYVCPVNGCTDEMAGNYNPEAVIEDGSCVYGPSECGGASTVTFDGYTYDLVAIGDQCWFAENLRTEHYANGDAIPGELSDGEWGNTTAGAQAVYNNDVSNLADYGRLYNWYAVDDGRGLCPSGWHVPTDGEWTALETYLGANGHGGTEGTALKSTSGWSGNGTDDFGFSALPGGYRYDFYGEFANAGDVGYWWSSSPSGGNAWRRFLVNSSPDILRNASDPRLGFSVRCLRDAD